jgi:hypothetical protein
MNYWSALASAPASHPSVVQNPGSPVQRQMIPPGPQPPVPSPEAIADARAMTVKNSHMCLWFELVFLVRRISPPTKLAPKAAGLQVKT